MHRHDPSTEVLTQAVVRYAVERMRMDPPPLDKTRSVAELRAMVGKTVTAKGIGGLEALRIFSDVLGPAHIPIDHPRFLSFVPAAPTEASFLFDLVVGASSIYGGSWLEGGGAVYAENEALRYIADLVGMPETAGGVFVTGGTAGNLSSLIAARFRWRHRADGAHDRTRVDADRQEATPASLGRRSTPTSCSPGDEHGRCRDPLRRRGRSRREDRDRVFAIVALPAPRMPGHRRSRRVSPRIVPRPTSGARGRLPRRGPAAPSVRDRYAGSNADSFIVDPHKWLFAPFDCCALVYRDPNVGRAAHTQHAEYLDVLHGGDDGAGHEWNPSDFAHHLSRRARGLPFWFSLATHGTEAYRDAIETALDVTRQGARLIDDADHLELIMEPELSILLFRERAGTCQYQAGATAAGGRRPS